MKRLLVLLGALCLAGCLDVSGPGPSNPLTETFNPSLGINLQDTSVWKQTANGTFFKDEVVGTGALLNLPFSDDSIFVAYSGYLKDATQFGSDSAARIEIDQLGVIGFLDGMVNMRVGGTRLLVIPSDLAYGNSSNGPIPANATLIFRITLNGFTSN